MRIASLATMLVAVFMTGCGDSKLDEIEERTLKLLAENPKIADAEIKDLDIEFEGNEGVWGDKYSGLLEVERDGKTIMFALDIAVNDEVIEDVIENGEKGDPIERKELRVFMEEVKE